MKLDGTHTRMLSAAVNRRWKANPSNNCLYRNLSKMSLVIKIGECNLLDIVLEENRLSLIKSYETKVYQA